MSAKRWMWFAAYMFILYVAFIILLIRQGCL